MNDELKRSISGIDFENIEKHPNILIAARFWDDKRYHAAKVCYRFMRMIDDLVDDRKAQGESISCLEKKELSEKVNSWIDCLDQEAADDPFYLELVRTITTFKIPLQLFHNFAKSMLHDIHHEGFSTLDEFLSYAEGASVAPASIFVHLCCLSEEEDEYLTPAYDIMEVARPCAIFSYLVHIIRDFQEDQLSHLNYFARDVLERHRLLPGDLRPIAEGAAIPGAFRSVIREYYELAGVYQQSTLKVLQDLSGKLSGRYLFSLHLIYQLYKMVFDRIDVEQGNFSRGELNPTPAEIRNMVLEVASRGYDANL
jgi:phytoene/squalene synthetase